MEKKQTAVQSLINEITGQLLNSILTGEKLSANEWNAIFDNYIEMEKQQILDAYYEGLKDVIPMDYYNNTFKKQ